MKECHIAVKPNKNAKQQAVEILPKLREHIPIERAQMRFKIVVPIKESKNLMKALKKYQELHSEAFPPLQVLNILFHFHHFDCIYF